MEKIRENVLYPPVSTLFMKQGMFVISGAVKEDKGIKGTSEFGIIINKRRQTVDVVAAQWTNDGNIHSVAVEAKLHNTARGSVGASLYQATDYQLFFDEVYTATQAGDLEDKKTVLENLGIGHISVDLKSKDTKLDIPSEIRHSARYSHGQNAKQVIPRLALPLVFLDLFGLPIRYMQADIGLWIAKDIVSEIQYNAGGVIEGDCYFAINIERIDDLRHIVRNVNRDRLATCLHNLTNEFMLNLGVHQVRTDKTLSTPIRIKANQSDVDQLIKVVEKEATKPLIDGRRKDKPHLTISCKLQNWTNLIHKQGYTACISDARDKLKPVMQVITDCF